MAESQLVPGSGGDAATSGTGPFCAVALGVFPKCVACHRGSGQFPDLSFEAAKTSIVGVASRAVPSEVLIVPGDSAASFLYRKLTGPLEGHEGAKMPFGGTLSADELAAVASWIDDGASTECDPSTADGGIGDGSVPRYHPENFALPGEHGLELKMGAQDCRTCHGEQLSGGSGPSCDSCHEQGWRTKCTFCHGGTDTETGAPPRDLDGRTVREELTFRAHTEHTTARNHAPYDCVQCHTKPTEVTSANHIFDDTPGRAEVSFAGGLSAGGSYEGSGRCSNLYCHGDGQSGRTGAYDHTFARPTCNTCHQGPGGSPEVMSGEHREHLREGVACTECHSATVDRSGSIIDMSRHVNGTRDIVFAAPGMSRTGDRCAGMCHDEEHESERW